jgi:hypothetical protein
LCQELLQAIDATDDWLRFNAAVDRARAALSTPPAATREAGPLPQAPPTEQDLYDLAEVFNGDPVPAMRRALELWGGAAALPVPAAAAGEGRNDAR